MITHFINSTINLLKRSDIRIHFPEYREVLLEEEGKTHTVHLFASDSFHQTKMEENLIFTALTFFTLLDSYIDVKDPSLEGGTLKIRYERLPLSNDNEIILKEIYRVLKIFRNSVVHSKSAITFQNNQIKIDYTFRGTNFKLEINKYGLELIYSVILMMLSTNPTLHDEGILRSYYDDIRQNLKNISDEFGIDNLILISNAIRLKRNVRYKIKNPNYLVDKDKGIVQIKRYDFEMGFSADYLITVENVYYLIPDEILDTNSTVPINEIYDWQE